MKILLDQQELRTIVANELARRLSQPVTPGDVLFSDHGGGILDLVAEVTLPDIIQSVIEP